MKILSNLRDPIIISMKLEDLRDSRDINYMMHSFYFIDGAVEHQSGSWTKVRYLIQVIILKKKKERKLSSFFSFIRNHAPLLLQHASLHECLSTEGQSHLQHRTIRVFSNLVCRKATSESPGCLFKCKSFNPIPDLLNESLGGGSSKATTLFFSVVCE